MPGQVVTASASGNTAGAPDSRSSFAPTVIVQPVLLVDDRIGTGWTMTVGAKLLRERDAPAVLPFALAVNT